MVLWKQPKLSVNRRHSSTFSGDTKSSATFKQDWKIDQTHNQEKEENLIKIIEYKWQLTEIFIDGPQRPIIWEIILDSSS